MHMPTTVPGATTDALNASQKATVSIIIYEAFITYQASL